MFVDTRSEVIRGQRSSEVRGHQRSLEVVTRKNVRRMEELKQLAVFLRQLNEYLETVLWTQLLVHFEPFQPP